VKETISKILYEAPDWSSELHGDERNKQAIKECNELIKEGRNARFRYRYCAVFLFFSFQCLVLLTACSTAFKIHCEGERQILFCDQCPSSDITTVFPARIEVENTKNQTLFCEREPSANNLIELKVYCAGESTTNQRLWCDQDPTPDNGTAIIGDQDSSTDNGTAIIGDKDPSPDNGTTFKGCEGEFWCNRYPPPGKRQFIDLSIVIAPIIAVAIQGMFYAFRPKWKSARLSLMQKRLESEKFKFRARIGQYDAFDSKRKGIHDSVREKFVDDCKKHFDSCIDADFQNGTIYRKWGTYEKHIEPHWVRFKRVVPYIFSKMKSCCLALISALKPTCIKLFCRRKTREAILYGLLRSKLKKNRTDIEAQEIVKIDTQDEHTHGALINVTSRLQRLNDHLQDAEEQRAKNNDEREKVKEDYEMFDVLDLDDYKKFRLEPQFRKFKTHLPWLIFWRNLIQISIILFTALSTFLGAFYLRGDRQLVFLIPISLALRSFLQETLTFYQLENRIPILHKHCVGGLKKALLAMNSPSTITRNQPTEKSKIISQVEMSILTYYSFMVEDQLENGREFQGDKYDSDGKDDDKEQKKSRIRFAENAQDGISNTSHANYKTE
jgi:hypothetical protein